jgi:hypothetical protein
MYKDADGYFDGIEWESACVGMEPEINKWTIDEIQKDFSCLRCSPLSSPT